MQDKICKLLLIFILSTHPAHVSALHELVMFDLAHAESDGVDVVLEVVGGHVVQVLRVLVSILDFVPLLRLCTSQVRLSCHVSRVTYVVVVVIVLGIVDGHLEPDHLLGPGGHSVVETYLIVTVHVRLLIVARIGSRIKINSFILHVVRVYVTILKWKLVPSFRFFNSLVHQFSPE